MVGDDEGVMTLLDRVGELREVYERCCVVRSACSKRRTLVAASSSRCFEATPMSRRDAISRSDPSRSRAASSFRLVDLALRSSNLCREVDRSCDTTSMRARLACRTFFCKRRISPRAARRDASWATRSHSCAWPPPHPAPREGELGRCGW